MLLAPIMMVSIPAAASPAGEATVPLRKPLRLNRPAANIELHKLKTFHIGRSFFELPWVPAPASTSVRDGLGPLFNVNTCKGCHVKGGRGDAPQGPGPLVDSSVIKLALGKSGDPIYGKQLQPRSIGLEQSGHGLSFVGEGKASVQYENRIVLLADGTKVELRRPKYYVTELRYGELDPKTATSSRVGPTLIGLGLVEEIAEDDIRSREDVDDSDGDGISGKANLVPDIAGGSSKLGRFGYKASQPSILQQSADAFRNDIGITSNIFPSETCTPKQLNCLETARRTSKPDNIEIDDQILNAVAYYVKLLGVPENRKMQPAEALRGSQLFNTAGCSACHVPSFTTRSDATLVEFSSLKIFPYSDFLLHDMGEGLADGVTEHQAEGREWRSTPLWGIGLVERVNPRAAYLHDGRARSIEEAILWHDGEAKQAFKAYSNFSKKEREDLIKFIRSL